MGQQTIIKKEAWDAYKSRMDRVEAAAAEISVGVTDYWWNLYEIYRDELWRAAFESLEEWIADISSEPWGPSRAKFFQRMTAIRRWKSLGCQASEIKKLLGAAKVAVEGDLDAWFDKNNQLKPDVEASIGETGKSPKEVLKEAAGMSPGEARKEIRSYSKKDQIWVDKTAVSFDERGGRIMFPIRHESDDAGLLGEWTITISAKRVKPDKLKGQTELPRDVAQFLLNKLT